MLRPHLVRQPYFPNGCYASAEAAFLIGRFLKRVFAWCALLLAAQTRVGWIPVTSTGMKVVGALTYGEI